MSNTSTASIVDQNELALTSLAEHLAAIDATITALATALEQDSPDHEQRDAAVVRALREFVSPQLRAEMSKLAALTETMRRSTRHLP